MSGVGSSSLLGRERLCWRAIGGAMRRYLNGAGEGEVEGILCINGTKVWVDGVLILWSGGC